MATEVFRIESHQAPYRLPRHADQVTVLYGFLFIMAHAENWTSMLTLEQKKKGAASHFANSHAARQAIDMALRMITPLLSEPDVCGSGFLHIVVMTPGTSPLTHDFEEAILLEHTIGNPADWDADYAAFARTKAKLSWETGMNGCAVQALHPHLLKKGDTLLTGGICLDGITVGVSGAHPWFDEAFGTAIAANLRALCKSAHAQQLQARLTTVSNARKTGTTQRLYA